jgi:hypothetical protein
MTERSLPLRRVLRTRARTHRRRNAAENNERVAGILTSSAKTVLAGPRTRYILGILPSPHLEASNIRDHSSALPFCAR